MLYDAQRQSARSVGTEDFEMTEADEHNRPSRHDVFAARGSSPCLRLRRAATRLHQHRPRPTSTNEPGLTSSNWPNRSATAPRG